MILGKNENLLIVGSLNANPLDRNMEREDIKSVQVLCKRNEIKALQFFHDQGTLGVSSITWKPDRPFLWYLTSGADLFEIDLEMKQVREIKISKLRGVHELSIIGDELWITNTFYDEIISYDLIQKKVLKRLQLIPRQKELAYIPEDNAELNKSEKINKFHCNQVFETFENEIFALVHHVTGVQLIKRVAEKLIKSQGNGGVLNIADVSSKRLKLKAPHTVRRVNGRYHVFDSGHAKLNVYSKNWTLEKEISMSGWGRGGDFSEQTQHYFCGISAKRNRYRKRGTEMPQPNKLEVYDINSYARVYECEVPNVEQINNLYLVSDRALDLLSSF